METIVAAVAHHAREQPDAPAIFFEGRTITYAELYRDAAQFAAFLLARRQGKGERIALFLDNCPEFVVAYLGTHMAGGIVVLVNSQYRQIELAHIMADAGVGLCVTDAAGAKELAKIELPQLEALVVVGDDEVANDASVIAYTRVIHVALHNAPQPHVPAPDDPALIGYTSGTTGRAKGALLRHRNLAANSAAIVEAWHWTASDTLLLTLPLFHAHGLMVGTHGTLVAGAAMILRRKFEATEVFDILQNEPRITLFFGVPTMYGRLLAEAARRDAVPRRLRLWVCGSAPLSPQLFDDFARVFGQTILERYGMTETGMNLTNPYDGERRAGTVGAPFPRQEARVVDMRTRESLPPGEIGEIEVRGDHVCAGYWNRPDATAAAFAPGGWFKTGDLGQRSADGYYTITGRARELIISGGYNVYPREVEDVLATHPAVAEVAVLGLPDPDFGEAVIAVIVPKSGTQPDPADIIAFCRERLAAYKKPRRVVFVESLPRNALGKVQKHILAAQLPEGRT